jgi:transcriptional regulator of nitric oxide reductase
MALEQGAAPHKIFVVPAEFGFEVQPPVVLTDSGDQCTIRNLTNYPVLVQLPNEIVVGGRELSLTPRGNAGDTQGFTVTGTVAGMYYYTVIVRVATESLRARGGSNPRIIIN